MKLHEFGRTHNDKGQAMVETALVLMLLVVLIFGMTEFGRAMYTKNSLNNAARTGARVAVVTTGITNTSSSVALAANCNYGNNPVGNDLVYQAICNSLFAGIDRTQITVTVSGASSPVKTGDAIQVNVMLGFTSLVPGLFGPNGFIKSFPSQLTGIATMRYE